MGAVSAPWALLIVGVAAASGIAAVIVYLATGAEPWLWAAVPACLDRDLCSSPSLGSAASSLQADEVVVCEQWRSLGQ